MTSLPRSQVEILYSTEAGLLDRAVWDGAHASVQDVLTVLTGEILRECPGANWEAGRAASQSLLLFSFRVFYHLDGDDDDPIVVGVCFEESSAGVRISGDISGEESGYIYFDENCERSVASGTDSVVEEATRIAQTLAAQHEIVIQAIRQRYSRARPRG